MAPQNERLILERFRATPAGQKLLQTIQYAEGTAGQNPYNVLFGGGRFSSYARHPDRVIKGDGIASAAAGAYQFMPDTWASASRSLGLPDFGPKSQDIAALKLARERLKPIGGLAVLENEGLSPRVANALAPEWASFPTFSGRSYWGQPVKSLAQLQARYAQQPGTTVANAGTEGTTPENVTPFQLPRVSLNEQLYRNLVVSLASQPENENRSFEKATELNAVADELEESDDPELLDLADQLRSQAVVVPRVAQSAALAPENILKTVFSTYKEVEDQNKKISDYEKFVNELNRSQLRQRAETSATSFTGITGPGGANRGITITSASDATGEPGIDYVVEGGKRGAHFYSPENAKVLKVVGDQNWETRLEQNPKGRTGYGNYIELRMTRPDGKQTDVRFAHFDAVNSGLKPGMAIPRGFLLGTQGRTGSTTGAHISADFYQPGTSVGDLSTRDYVRSRIPSGRFF